MNFLELRCRLEKCIIDNTQEMEFKKCCTQNDNANPDKFQPCTYLAISTTDKYLKGDVWKKFGDIVDKSKKNHKKKPL